MRKSKILEGFIPFLTFAGEIFISGEIQKSPQNAQARRPWAAALPTCRRLELFLLPESPSLTIDNPRFLLGNNGPNRPELNCSQQSNCSFPTILRKHEALMWRE